MPKLHLNRPAFVVFNKLEWLHIKERELFLQSMCYLKYDKLSSLVPHSMTQRNLCAVQGSMNVAEDEPFTFKQMVSTAVSILTRLVVHYGAQGWSGVWNRS